MNNAIWQIAPASNIMNIFQVIIRFIVRNISKEIEAHMALFVARIKLTINHIMTTADFTVFV